MVPTNKDIAKKLRYVAAVYLLLGVNRFKIVAYDRAAEAIDQSSIELYDLWKDGKLTLVDGVGPSIASHLDEWFKKGQSDHLDKILDDAPASMFPLLDVPGFGPKKAFKLVTTLKLGDPKTIIEDMKKAAKAGKIATIEGFGETSQADILQRLEEYKEGSAKEARMPLPIAYDQAQALVAYMKTCPSLKRIEVLGSLRRMSPTIGDIDLAAATDNPEEVLEWFIKYPQSVRMIEKGPATASILITGLRHVDLMVQPVDHFGSLLQHFTGSRAHNIKLREYALKKGMSLSEYGIANISVKRKAESEKLHRKIEKFDTEEKFYNALGLEWIPPEMREDRGEIEASLKKSLPRLIQTKDIKGDLHMHSNYDLKPSHDLGQSSMEELVKNAQRLGYEYIGISDHNPKVSDLSEKEIVEIMKKRKDYIEHIKDSTKSTRVHILSMLEIDITPDGALALPEKAFDYIDAAVVSLHSRLDQSREVATKRVLKALSHPKAKIWGHPTGRQLLERKGVDVEWESIFDFCLKNDKALEINSWPQRLDLPDNLVFQAREKGIKFVIDTDSHHKDHMDNMHFGVSVARRGWLEKKDVLNTLGWKDFSRWILSN